MNLALFGDPYYVRMILHNANYVYKKCRTVYVPELLVANDNLDVSCNVVGVESVIDNPDAIDEVLTFFRDNSFPLQIKKRLNKTSKCILVRNINTKNIPKSFKQKNYNSALLKGKPAILSLSMGQASQQYHIEMLINRYLRKMNLNFYQCFSPESQYILMNQNFNNSCLDICEECKFNHDLFVGGLTTNGINELLDEQSQVCSLIKKMSPDAVVISCNATQSYIDNNIYPAINILKYRYNIRQIIVVISEYYFNESLDVSIKIPPQIKIADGNYFYLSNFNKKTETEFITQLLSTVYLPDGILPV